MTGALPLLAAGSRITLPPTGELFVVLIVLAAVALMKGRIVLTTVLITVALLFAGVASTIDHATRMLDRTQETGAVSFAPVDQPSPTANPEK
ncbi:MAG: hypothetical protein ACQSGP_26340 [Frankia sp.]